MQEMTFQGFKFQNIAPYSGGMSATQVVLQS
jgi:hypothetical protein